VSQERAAILRQANEAFNRGDVEAFLALCVEEVEIEDLNNAPDLPRVARGGEAVRAMLAAWRSSFSELSGELEEYIEAGDRHLACLVRYRGRLRDSTAEVDFRGVDLWEFRGSKLARGTLGYADRRSALEALGRSP
jgi:ketosteroid isomerase-like protein